MATRTDAGGASAPSTRLDLADWLGLSLFIAPLVIAAGNWLVGGL